MAKAHEKRFPLVPFVSQYIQRDNFYNVIFIVILNRERLKVLKLINNA